MAIKIAEELSSASGVNYKLVLQMDMFRIHIFSVFVILLGSLACRKDKVGSDYEFIVTGDSTSEGVIYTPINARFLSSSFPVYFDLNKNGTKDIMLTIAYLDFRSHCSGESMYIEASRKTGFAFWVSDSLHNCIKILEPGIKIIDRCRWSKWYFGDMYSHSHCPNGFDASCVEWDAVNNKYIGFRMQDENKIYYGWIKLDANHANSITIKSFACRE